MQLHGAEGESGMGVLGCDDVNGILDTVDVPIVIVNRDCKVVRFNRAASEVLALQTSDIGRLPRDIRPLAHIKNLEKLCHDVIADGAATRRNVDNCDQSFVLRIAPYKASEPHIAGAVLTFTNVTVLRASITKAIYEREFTKAILNSVVDALVVLDADLRVQTANRAFYTIFGISREQAQDVSLFDLGDREWKLSGLWSALKATLLHDHPFQSVEIERDFPTGRKNVVIDACRISQDGVARNMILLTFHDITDRKHAEAV